MSLNRFIISAIDPTCDLYPGGRGTDELIIYTKNYHLPTTGTNEFGLEVIVKDGLVVSYGANNSKVPSNGFILSGHGKAQKWLQNNLWYGSRVTINTKSGINEIEVLTNNETERIGANLFIKSMEENNLFVDQKTKDAVKEGKLLRKEIEDIYLMSLPSRKVEVRGIWHEQTERNPEEIRETVSKLKRGGFNLLLLEVYYHGYTIYPSELVSQQKEYVGWDPLEVWRDECEKAGIEIHAWVHCFFAGFKEPGSVLDQHPEWAAKRKDGKEAARIERNFHWLEPTLKEVEDFLLALFQEIVDKYGFKGLHLDYIRYADSERFEEVYSYSESSLEAFRQETGLDGNEITPNDPQWQRWLKFREDNISKFVKKCRDKFPQLLLSTAIFPELEHAKEKKGQDWALWLKNGWLDYLAPMIYSTDNEYVVRKSKFSKEIAPQTPIYTGVAPFMGLTPFELTRQIFEVSHVVPGTISFALHSVKDAHMEALRKGIYKEDAVLPWNQK